MTTRDDPGVYRRQVRIGLREARKAADRTQQEVATALDWSLSKVIRIENGSVSISTTDLRALLAYYGITDNTRVELLVAAARASRGRPWWHTYHELIRPQFAELLTYESTASAYRTYNPTIITSLLQHPEYATALRVHTVPNPEIRERLVELLAGRQERFYDDGTPVASFIVDEAALRRTVGGAAIMAKQASFLKNQMQKSNTSIRILPFTAGAHSSLSGPFILLEFPDDDDDVIFFEGIQGDTISREDNALRTRYFEIFDELWEKSLTEDASADMLDRLHEQYAATTA